MLSRQALFTTLPLAALTVAAGWYALASSASHGGDAGRVEITWMMSIDPNKPLYEEMVGRFEQQHPDIDVRLIWVPSLQYNTKFKTLVAAGQAPDLFYCGDVWIAYLLPFLADITDRVERDRQEIDLEDFYPELLRACQWDGRYYYLPRYFNVSLLYYNRGLFDEAGEPYPSADWTWDDYVSAAQRLTRRTSSGQVDVWGSDIVTGWWGEWLTLVRQSGGDFFSPDLSSSALSLPASIRGLQFYSDKVHTLGISPPPGFRPENGFASGVVAMSQGGHTGDWRSYRQIDGLRWDIQLLPSGPAGRRGGELAVDAVGISRASRHPEEAWRLLKYLVSRECVRELVEEGFVPVRRSVAQETLLAGVPGQRSQDPQHGEILFDALQFAEPIPRHPDFIEIALDIVQPEVDLMLQGSQTPEQTGERAARAVNEFLATMGPAREAAR